VSPSPVLYIGWIASCSNSKRYRPRWLVENGKVDQAGQVLDWLREENYTTTQIEIELDDIQQSVNAGQVSGRNWKSLFKEPALFARLWRAALLQFMAQMCGATAMKYYLPTLLKALGWETRFALMAGAIEMTLKIGFTILEMFLIDRLGRRLSLALGCAVMASAMFVGLVSLVVQPRKGNASMIADDSARSTGHFQLHILTTRASWLIVCALPSYLYMLWVTVWVLDPQHGYMPPR
jgi:hypothetical protein